MLREVGLPPRWDTIPAERLLRPVVGPDPAAGVEASVVVPGGVTWVLYSVEVTLVTSAVVANRRPSLAFSDGTTEFFRSLSGANLAASLTGVFCWFPTGVGFGGAGAAGAITGAMWPMPLLPGFRISTSTLLLDVGDNYGPMALYVAEYIGSNIARTTERAERDFHGGY